MRTEILHRIDRAADRTVSAVGAVVGWLLLLLIAIIIFDVVTRRFFVMASLALQELEWHLHAALFALTVGYAYVRNAHIRIDLIRDRLDDRRKAWIEVAGCVLFLLPYCLVVIYFSADYAYGAFRYMEGSKMPGGLPYRWVIKSTIPLGIALLLVAGIGVFCRNLLVLLDPRDRR